MTRATSPRFALSADLPETMAKLQARIEALYTDKTTLEQELQQLRAQPPLVMVRPPRANALVRLAMRLVPRLRRRRDIKVIRECALFDAKWYLKTYPDVAKGGVDPAAHFATFALRERRNPGPHFDTAHYLHLYPDIEQNEINPLVHYVMAGNAEGRSIRPEMPHLGG